MAGSVSNRCSIITLHTNQTTPPARKGEMVKRITAAFQKGKFPHSHSSRDGRLISEVPRKQRFLSNNVREAM